MISKDQHYAIYDAAIHDGMNMVKDWLGDSPDLFHNALERFSKSDRKMLMKASDEDVMKAVKNYHDGIEDGIKAQLHREYNSYREWLKRAS